MSAQEKIVKLLLKGQLVTAKEIAKKTGLTYQTVLHTLKDMPGVRKSKVRQGTRGPLATAFQV